MSLSLAPKNLDLETSHAGELTWPCAPLSMRYVLIADGLLERAEMLVEIRRCILSPDHATGEDLRLSFATLAVSELLRTDSINELFTPKLCRAIHSLTERAATLPQKSREEIISEILAREPRIRRDDIVEIEHRALWILAAVKDSALAELSYEGNDSRRKGVGGVHFPESAIALTDPLKNTRLHELVHTVNSSFGGLQDGVLTLRLKALGEQLSQLPLTFAHACLDDLHEELVAEILSKSYDPAKGVLPIYLNHSDPTQDHWHLLSTAGERVNLLLADVRNHNSLPVPEKNSFREIFTGKVNSAVSAATAVLCAASLVGTDMKERAEMMLYLLRPSQWVSLPRMMAYGFPGTGIALALECVESLRSPLGSGKATDFHSMVKHFGEPACEFLRRTLDHAALEPLHDSVTSPEQLKRAEERIIQMARASQNRLGNWHVKSIAKKVRFSPPSLFSQAGARLALGCLLEPP